MVHVDIGSYTLAVNEPLNDKAVIQRMHGVHCLVLFWFRKKRLLGAPTKAVIMWDWFDSGRFELSLLWSIYTYVELVWKVLIDYMYVRLVRAETATDLDLFPYKSFFSDYMTPVKKFILNLESLILRLVWLVP